MRSLGLSWGVVDSRVKWPRHRRNHHELTGGANRLDRRGRWTAQAVGFSRARHWRRRHEAVRWGLCNGPLVSSRRSDVRHEGAEPRRHDLLWRRRSRPAAVSILPCGGANDFFPRRYYGASAGCAAVPTRTSAATVSRLRTTGVGVHCWSEEPCHFTAGTCSNTHLKELTGCGPAAAQVPA